jgi:hypothetical protein
MARQVHAFVPLEQNCRAAVPPPPPPAEQYIDEATGQPMTWFPPPEPTHAHTLADMPNQIDRNGGGWVDTGACFSEEPVYKLTTGFCRGPGGSEDDNFMWPAGHQGAGSMWDCSPSGGMDGGSYLEEQGQGLSRDQCKDFCDRDPMCGAFDIESHATSGQTRSECCLFRAGVKGEGDAARHCYIKGTGENADTSIRPRGHWTKTISPSERDAELAQKFHRANFSRL